MADETELKRLYWHSRRGMLELDVLLVPFVQEVYPGLDAEDRRASASCWSARTRTCSVGSCSAASRKTPTCGGWCG